MSENSFSFKIYIVFDNCCVKKGFLAGFGFSALIYNFFTENYLLFDTGGNAEILLHNLEEFNVDVADIRKVIISHNHYDHSGGLDGVYRRNPEIEIYVPLENAKSYENHYFNSKVIGVKSYTLIEKNVFSSGQFSGFIPEQALFLKTKNDKMIVLVGCAHPGLEKFIIKAREISDIKAIIGGFHGFRKFSYLENIEVIGACHCTSHKNQIQRRFPNLFKKICVGSVLFF
ncbi:MAG: MBL fold metallo-hydrolase [Promethearchaeota archaeon]